MGGYLEDPEIRLGKARAMRKIEEGRTELSRHEHNESEWRQVIGDPV